MKFIIISIFLALSCRFNLRAADWNRLPEEIQDKILNSLLTQEEKFYGQQWSPATCMHIYQIQAAIQKVTLTQKCYTTWSKEVSTDIKKHIIGFNNTLLMSLFNIEPEAIYALMLKESNLSDTKKNRKICTQEHLTEITTLQEPLRTNASRRFLQNASRRTSCTIL